jgi:GNAT superfamily N-acetyltransferase
LAVSENELVVEFREISASRGSDVQLLRRFYAECLIPAFPDEDERESLENIEDYLQLKEDGKYGANNYHVIVSCDGDKPIAGSIFDYLVEPNAGVIEFLLVSPGLRQTGLASRLLRQTEAAIAADAQRAGQQVAWLVAELDDPFRVSLAESDFNPFTRASIWHRWGYRMLDFRYIQPALSAEKSPVTTLLLAAKTLAREFAETIPTERVLTFLREYMRWAMRIETPETDPVYREVAERLRGAGQPVALMALGDYAGADDLDPRLRIEEAADPDDPEFTAALQVYSAVFTRAATAVSADEFRHELSSHGVADSSGCRYHLWSIHRPRATRCEGMASFFTLPTAGFGGYVGLVPPLRGGGFLNYLMARIERQMIEDTTDARGLYIECSGELERDIFVKPRFGFYELDVPYTQPAAAGVAVLSADRLHLLYKPFGRVYEQPELSTADFQDAMAEILTVVYGVEDPRSSRAYLQLERSLADCQMVPVVPK